MLFEASIFYDGMDAPAVVKSGSVKGLHKEVNKALTDNGKDELTFWQFKRLLYNIDGNLGKKIIEDYKNNLTFKKFDVVRRCGKTFLLEKVKDNQLCS